MRFKKTSKDMHIELITGTKRSALAFVYGQQTVVQASDAN